jgi:hypothetical protein
MSSLLKTGTNALVPSLFGDKSGAVVNALSSASGIKKTSATTLIAMIVPLVLTWLKKVIGDLGLNARSLDDACGPGPEPERRGRQPHHQRARLRAPPPSWAASSA